MASRGKRVRRHGVQAASRRFLRLGMAGKVLSFALSFLIATQPLLVQAQQIQADQAANRANQPGVGASANGVPLIDIVTPNAAGLSHNKYSDFNVDTSGVILNNSNQTVSRSQLGGLVQGNANLHHSGPAGVILNEVTGGNRSVLEGAIEVHGRPANVVIANPHGLTCDGCGFINTPRATLSSGVPEIGADGSLSGLRIEGGDVRIGANGADLGAVNIFDIVSRKIAIDGPVRAGGNLNLVAGRNAYDYSSGLVTPLASDGNEPAIAIDSSLLGGMYAGSIKIISTDAGAGVRMSGQMAANTGAMTLTADGKLTIGKAQAKGTITARSKKQIVQVENTLFSDEAIQLEGVSGVELADNALVVSAGDVSLKGRTVSLGSDALVASGTDRDGVQTTTGKLSVEASTLSAGQGQLAAAGLLSIRAGTIDLTRVEDTNNATLRSRSDIVIEAASIKAKNGRIIAAGDLTLKSTDSLSLSDGYYIAGGMLLGTAVQLTSSASLAAQSVARLETQGGNLNHSGEIAGNGGSVLSSARDITNSGRIVSADKVDITAEGTLHNEADGLVAAAEGITVSVDALINDGAIEAQGGTLNIASESDLANTGLLLSVKDANVTAGDKIDNKGDLLVGETLVLRATSLDNMGSIGSVGGSLLVELVGDLSNTGLLYSATSSTYSLDGNFTNINADVLAETDLTIRGLTSDRAGHLENISGTIEAVAGDILINAATITNRRDGLTVELDTTSETTQSGTTTTTVVTTHETATLNGPAAQLLAGGNITIDTETLTNSYSQIAAGGDIAIKAGSVLNEGRDLIETITTTAVTHHSQRYCSSRIFKWCIKHKTRHWTTTDTSTASSTLDAIFGTIEAGGTLLADVSGYLANNAVREQAGQIGLSSGDRALSAADIDKAAQARDTAQLSAIDVSIDALLGRQATFQQVADPNMPYLIETRSEFIDPSRFLGSDYFLNLIGGYNPDMPLKRLGDAYVEYRLIRDQIFNLTGSRAFGSNLDPNELMQLLYDNAAEASQELELSFGVALTAEQRAALTKDIVWLEKQMVDGQEVLVPRLYLSTSTLANVNLASAQIKAGEATINTAVLTNSGAIATSGNLTIDTSAALINHGGSLFAGHDITIDAGSIFSNSSGTVSGHNVVIEADTIINDTASVRDVHFNGFADRAQQTARIEAVNDLLLEASGSIIAQGGQFAAGNDMSLQAGDSIEITALALERLRDDRIKGGYDRSHSLTNQLAGLQAGGNLSLEAGDNLLLHGVKAEAGENITLQAEGDISIVSVQDQTSHDLKLDIKSGGFLGTETNIRRQSSSATTKATTITAGEDVSIISRSGNVVLQSPQIKSGGETLLQAQAGKVALLTNTDHTFSQDYKREEDLFWWNLRDQGAFEETISHVEIEAGGGLRINAGDGIIIEYHQTGNLQASLDQLAQAPGLAWINDIRNDPALADQIDWRAVEAQFEEWDYKAQGLTEAGAALVTLAVTALTAGATGFTATLTNSLASTLGIKNVAMQAALRAGVQTLINKSAVALINNKGNIGAALKELGSSANLRALATSMVTAGLTTQITGMMDLKDVAPGASFKENLVNAAQRHLIEASIRAGVNMTIGGEDPKTALANSFRLAAASTIGSVLANHIGNFAAFNGIKDGDIQKVVLHAMAGCAAAAVGSDDCLAGAIGAGLGELLGKPIAEAIPDPAQQTAFLSLIAGAAGALASRSASAVDAAAQAAATTHQYNYLNHEELQEAIANRNAMYECLRNLGWSCSQEELQILIEKDADFVELSQKNTRTLLHLCSTDPTSYACVTRRADLLAFADLLKKEREFGLGSGFGLGGRARATAEMFSVQQSIFIYDLILAEYLSDTTKSPDVAIRDFMVGMSKREGGVNAFLSAVGVIGGIAVCASGVGTMACAAGALTAVASANHLYGDVQQTLTGEEARTALVQALTANGISPEEANKYQEYVDNGVIAVDLITGGRQAVRFIIKNPAKINPSHRAAITNLEQQSAKAAGNITAPLDVPGVVQSRINLANKETRFTPLKKNGEPVDAGWEHVVERHFGGGNSQSQFTLPQTEVREILQSKQVVSTPVSEIKFIGETPTYVRTVDIGRPVGTVRQAHGGGATSKITIQTDRAGNIITAYPVP